MVDLHCANVVKIIICNRDKYKQFSSLRNRLFITHQEDYGSTGSNGGNPAVWQVDKLTSSTP